MLDISLFLKLIIAKLPPDLVDCWRVEAFKYKEVHNVTFLLVRAQGRRGTTREEISLDSPQTHRESQAIAHESFCVMAGR